MNTFLTGTRTMLLAVALISGATSSSTPAMSPTSLNAHSSIPPNKYSERKQV